MSLCVNPTSPNPITDNDACPDHLGIVGLIGRFKPVTNGHASLLEAVCSHSDHVYIGLGSSNVYDAQNPFTAAESEEMIDAALKGKYRNYSFVRVPDTPSDQEWVDSTTRSFGSLDCFVSGNPWVQGLLGRAYRMVHPDSIIPDASRVDICATQVRSKIVAGDGWQRDVPASVAGYITSRGLDVRLRREFGSEPCYLMERADRSSRSAQIAGAKITGAERLEGEHP